MAAHRRNGEDIRTALPDPKRRGAVRPFATIPMAQLATSFEEGCDIVAALKREDAFVEVFRNASPLEQGLSLRSARDYLQWVNASVTKSFAAGVFAKASPPFAEGNTATAS